MDTPKNSGPWKNSTTRALKKGLPIAKNIFPGRRFVRGPGRIDLRSKYPLPRKVV
jgi:hypothetical protein